MLSKRLAFLAASAAGLLSATFVAATPVDTGYLCPPNSSPAAIYQKCVCNSGFYSGGTTAQGYLARCYPVCAPNQYPEVDRMSNPIVQDDGSVNCLSCPLFSTSTGTQKSCTCSSDNPRLTTNPAGQANLCGCPPNSALSGNDCVCKAGYYAGGTQANGKLKRCYPICPVNKFPELTNTGYATGNCLACPKYSTSTGATFQCTCQATNPVLRTTAAGQTAECGCPPNASKDANGNCQCDSGFYSGGTNGNGSLARCYNVCPANQYPTLQGNGNPVAGGGCTACPPRSTSNGSQRSCTCAAGTTKVTTTGAGQINKCSACPAGTTDSEDGTSCVATEA